MVMAKDEQDQQIEIQISFVWQVKCIYALVI